MSGETLVVDPAVLSGSATAFSQAGAGLAGLGADAPLSEAAAAVPELETASACHTAQSTLAADTSAAAEAAGTFGGNLGIAANQYETQDRAAADSINGARLPRG